MATVVSNFDHVSSLLENKHSVRVIVRPVVPDNDLNWQVFDNDEQIAMFIQQSCEFIK